MPSRRRPRGPCLSDRLPPLFSALELTLILLAASVVAVVILRLFNLPPLVAYLAVGVLLGPAAENFGAGSEVTHTLAELGVVFLMFSIGLEFNLSKLRSMRSLVFGLGASQVGTTILLVVGAFALMPSSWAGWLLGPGTDWRGWFAIGGAAAMSSTALVVKMLTERREMESEHGRRAFAVLLFQDLAVIPLLILIPALAADTGMDGAQAILIAGAKAVVILVVLLRFGPPLMRRWFNLVARQRSHEVFTLNVLLATLFFAWLTERAGLSMELGAFVGGMLIAETEFRYQVEEDIKPFRDVLLGLFFITVGMRLNLMTVAGAWDRVLTLMILPVVLKAVLVAGLSRVFGAAPGTSIRSGIWLAQAGEFGFVLLGGAAAAGLLSDTSLQPIYAAMLLSMLFSPLLVLQANRLALRFSGSEWLQRSLQLQRIAAQSLARDQHVVICGYGRCGQSLAHVLEAENVAYVALDLDPDRVRQAAAAGESVVYGDSSRRDTLVAAGLHRARALVVSFDDVGAAMRLIHTARALAPQLPIVVRASQDADVDRLRDAGATEVVHEIVEGSLMLASHALALTGVPLARVLRRVRDVREKRYTLLQGFFHGADDRTDEIEIGSVHLRSVTLAADSTWAGRELVEATSRDVRVTALVRRNRRIVSPPGETRLESGDTLVLAGTIDAISEAEARLVGAA